MPLQQRPDLVIGILVASVFTGLGPVLSRRLPEVNIADVAQGDADCTVGKFTKLCRLRSICEGLQDSEAKQDCTDTLLEVKERMTYMDKSVRASGKDPEYLKEEYFVFDETQYPSPAKAFDYCIKEGNRALQQVQAAVALKLILEEGGFNEQALATKVQEVQEVSEDAKLTSLLDEWAQKIPLLSAPPAQSKSERQKFAALLEGIYERLLVTFGAFTQRARDTSFAKQQVTVRLEQQLAVGNLFLRWLSSFIPERKDSLATQAQEAERRKGLLRGALEESDEMPDLMLKRLSKNDVWFNLQLLRYDPNQFMKQHQSDFIKFSVAKLTGPELRALVAHFGYRDRSPYPNVLHPPGTKDGVIIKQAFLNNLWAAFDDLTGLKDDTFLQFLASLASGTGAEEPAPNEATILPSDYAVGLSDDSCAAAVGSQYVMQGSGFRAKWVLQSPKNDAASFASSLEKFLLMDPDAESQFNGCLLWGTYGIGPYTNGPPPPIKEVPKTKSKPQKQKKHKKRKAGPMQSLLGGIKGGIKLKKTKKKARTPQSGNARPKLSFLDDLKSATKATKKRMNPFGGNTDLMTELQATLRKRPPAQ